MKRRHSSKSSKKLKWEFAYNEKDEIVEPHEANRIEKYHIRGPNKQNISVKIRKCETKRDHFYVPKSYRTTDYEILSKRGPINNWHLTWQSVVKIDYTEVSVNNHRADIKCDDLVIEIQYSDLSLEDIQSRIKEYPRLIWIVHAVCQKDEDNISIENSYSFSEDGHIIFQYGSIKNSSLISKLFGTSCTVYMDMDDNSLYKVIFDNVQEHFFKCEIIYFNNFVFNEIGEKFINVNGFYYHLKKRSKKKDQLENHRKDILFKIKELNKNLIETNTQFKETNEALIETKQLLKNYEDHCKDCNTIFVKRENWMTICPNCYGKNKGNNSEVKCRDCNKQISRKNSLKVGTKYYCSKCRHKCDNCPNIIKIKYKKCLQCKS